MREKLFRIIIAALLVFMNIPYVRTRAAIPVRHTSALYIDARCAIAMDSKTKIVLYEHNSDMIVPMASTTKIVTALVALKYSNLDKKVEISKRAANIRGSTVGFKQGEQITIRELVYGLMLRSGNDAAIAIAEGISGSVEEFLKLMNEYACEIGLVDTHFESPHGLDSANHYTTAYDLALVTAKAKEIKEFSEIVAAKDIEGTALGFTRNYHNINKILWQIPAANGVKTGFTGQAGKCLVSSIGYDNNDIIIVVLNSRTRWKETKKIYDYIVKNYEYKRLASMGDEMGTIPIGRSTSKVNLKCSSDVIVPVKKSATITSKVIKSADAPASILKGDKLGSLNVYEDDKLIYSMPLECDNNVSRKNRLSKIFRFNHR